MRITGGKARGIALKTLAVKKLRPATDRMREALFASLGAAVVDKRVLDLFAGSGAYGLEALSRDAESVSFVERSSKQIACLRANLAAVLQSCGREAGATHVHTTNVFTWRPFEWEYFDWIFADPPYALIPQQAAVLFARVRPWLKPKASSLLLLEAPGEFDWIPAGWELLRRLGKPGHPGEPTVLICTPLD